MLQRQSAQSHPQGELSGGSIARQAPHGIKGWMGGRRLFSMGEEAHPGTRGVPPWERSPIPALPMPAPVEALRQTGQFLTHPAWGRQRPPYFRPFRTASTGT